VNTKQYLPCSVRLFKTVTSTRKRKAESSEQHQQEATVITPPSGSATPTTLAPPLSHQLRPLQQESEEGQDSEQRPAKRISTAASPVSTGAHALEAIDISIQTPRMSDMSEDDFMSDGGSEDDFGQDSLESGLFASHRFMIHI